MKDVLFALNPWWRTASVADVPLFAREELSDILSELATTRRCTIITGPRRTGKSTLLMQTVRQLLQTGANSKRILFFYCLEPGLQTSDLATIWQYYFSEILGEPINGLTETVYLLIDEIHFSKDWQLYIKSVIGKRYKVKFIVTGLSASALFMNAKDSLMGRTHTVKLLPMAFKQFLKLKRQLCADGASIPEILTQAVNIFDSNELTNLSASFDVKFHSPLMINFYKEFIAAGGYPEYFLRNSFLTWQRFLIEDVVDYGLYRDIVSFYKIRHPELLRKLLYYISANLGAAMPVSTIAQDVLADRVTASEYLDYLQDASMLNIVANHSNNKGKALRKNKKYYIVDCGVRNAMLKRNEFTPKDEGLLAETASLIKLKQLVENIGGSVYYYRENTTEIDFILDTNSCLLPVEVKYRNKITAADYKPVLDFIKTNHSPQGIILTKNSLEIKNDVVLIPAWLI